MYYLQIYLDAHRRVIFHNMVEVILELIGILILKLCFSILGWFLDHPSGQPGTGRGKEDQGGKILQPTVRGVCPYAHLCLRQRPVHRGPGVGSLPVREDGEGEDDIALVC